MLIDINNAKRFASRVVQAMIRLGCDAATMRRHEIPTFTFYGILGGGRHRGGYNPDDVARENMQQYRNDYLYKKTGYRKECQ